MRYEVQCLMINDEWQNPDDKIYSTQAEAEIDLRDMIEECEYAVSMGYMEDFNANEWRVQECEYEGEEC